MVFLDGAESLREEEIVQRQLVGRVAPTTEAKAGIDALRASGLIAATDGPQWRPDERSDSTLSLTPAGRANFEPIRQAVSTITDELQRDLPEADLEATRRTLTEIARRAHQMLTST